MDNSLSRALQDALAMAIAAKTSREVSDIMETYPISGVVVYWDAPKVGRATRTEIKIGDALVIVHKNPNVAGGMFAAKAYFTEVIVVVGGQEHVLRISIDPRTAESNPIYLFYDGDREIGKGYGQRMDMRLASALTGKYVGGMSDGVAQEVVDWIRGKISPTGA